MHTQDEARQLIPLLPSVHIDIHTLRERTRTAREHRHIAIPASAVDTAPGQLQDRQ